MAFKKDTKIKNNFTKITVALASPEEILENSYGEVTKPEQTSQSVTDSSASAFSVRHATMSVRAESTSAYVIKALSATDAVLR